ncbi:hypothetical protein EI555_000889 [Monodon monoceros]|uniref:Small ribosomal subunit protein eS6 n=1 Tax=Monodon monoceros TaxID=40151 RepID=A0A4U1FIB3_MONMO|nr:hypothetical protein EI555_000889 [Monodon monoceros]
MVASCPLAGIEAALLPGWRQLNISFPATGCQKLIEVDDERKLRTFYEKRMATEVAADALGEEWKEAKEKRQEQIAKRRRLSSLRASTSKSESSQK